MKAKYDHDNIDLQNTSLIISITLGFASMVDFLTIESVARSKGSGLPYSEVPINEYLNEL